MKKIVFIEPNPPDFHIFSRMPLPRLGTVLLGTRLREAGYEVKSYVESVGELDLEDVFSADAVGISTITSTSMRSYEIAKLLRAAGIPVFMGGAHVTYMPEEALRYCDYVLRGESDDVIVDFVRALERGGGFEKIPGLSFRRDGEVVHNEGVSFCKDLDTLPCPDFSFVSGLETQGLKKLEITPIMTSRGCPYDCSFCSVTSMFGHRYRFRSHEMVIRELENHREQEGDWVFFYDDNFAAHRKRTKELLHRMIEKDLTPLWTAQVRVEVARDQELLDLMRRSNCHTVYIGLESINPRTLEAYNKKQSVEDIEKCIRTLHDNGIRVHGMFVFGSDDDTVDTIDETVRFCKRNDIESVQFLILTPLPGTKFFFEMERQGRILTRDWALYDAHHVVFEPRLMSCYELQSEMLRATREFYSLWQIAKRAVRLDLFNVSIKAYGRNLVRQWTKKNQYFLDYTKSLADRAGKRIELAAKQTAEDIKDKFRKLEMAGSLSIPKTHHMS
ncbi:MAG TPA: B12-binding domain-containing radical SAM protein [Deltaproteobacteria bacterium]|nr:B12-binding domain-containing radical SAM protein [Deltaproteobacteria bacterium]